MYNYVQWCIFEYILYKGCGKCGRFVGSRDCEKSRDCLCIKSGYGAAFDTKMLSCAIMIRQGPRMSLRSVRGIVVDAHKLSNPIVKFKIQI